MKSNTYNYLDIGMYNSECLSKYNAVSKVTATRNLHCRIRNAGF